MKLNQQLVFCKLGGSIITDKMRPETVHHAVLERLAREIAAAATRRPALRLLLGHGSGSFGHMAARTYGTRDGVRSASDWQGFVHVAAVAARLGQIVSEALLEAGLPVWSLPPSASARCTQRELVSMSVVTVAQALSSGLMPMVRGDVVLDDSLGGTIVSTEQVFAFLARQLLPASIVLVSDVDGVFEGDPRDNPGARRVPHISSSNWHQVRGELGASHAVDVTGGMLAKVEQMVALAQALPGLTIHIVSGERPGILESALCEPVRDIGGTVIRWAGMT